MQPITDKVAAVIVALLLGTRFFSDSKNKQYAKNVSSILINEIFPRLAAEGMDLDDPEQDRHDEINGYLQLYHYGFIQLISDCAVLSTQGLLKPRHVKKIIGDCWTKYVGYGVVQYLRETDLLEETQGGELTDIVRQAIQENQRAAAEYKNGKEKALGAIVGAVMKKTKADPTTVQSIIKEILSSQ